MSLGLIGYKRGMTKIFNDQGDVSVTIIQVLPNYVSQIKTIDTDGYTALQLASGVKKRLNKCEAGHLRNASVPTGKDLVEFVVTPEEAANYKLGDEIKADLFSPGQVIDVTGTSKGKGFAGTVKRWHFSMQDATHGNSLSHRAPGSIGQRQSPGRVFKGKKMSGHLGDVTRTIQNLNVVAVDVEHGLICVEGGIPGSSGGMVLIKPAVKQKNKAKDKA